MLTCLVEEAVVSRADVSRNRLVTVYLREESAGSRAEVRRQHCEVLYATDHHDSEAGAMADARLWMDDNGFVLGPYRA